MTIARLFVILTIIFPLFASRDQLRAYFKLNTEDLNKKGQKSLGLGMAVDRRNARNPYDTQLKAVPVVESRPEIIIPKKKPELGESSKGGLKANKFIDIFEVPDEPFEDFNGHLNLPRRKPVKFGENKPPVTFDQNGKPVYDFSNQDSNFMMPNKKPSYDDIPGFSSNGIPKSEGLIGKPEQETVIPNRPKVNFFYPIDHPVKLPIRNDKIEKPDAQNDNAQEKLKNPATKTIEKTEVVDVYLGDIPEDEKTPGGQHVIKKVKVNVEEGNFDIPEDSKTPGKNGSPENLNAKSPVQKDSEVETKSPQKDNLSPKIGGDASFPAKNTPIKENLSPEKSPKTKLETITKVDVLPNDDGEIPDDKNIGEVQKSPLLTEKDAQTPTNQGPTLGNRNSIKPITLIVPEFRDTSFFKDNKLRSPAKEKTPKEKTPFVQKTPKEKTPTGADVNEEITEASTNISPNVITPIQKTSPTSSVENNDSMENHSSPISRKETNEFDELGLDEPENKDFDEQDEEDPVELRDVVNKLKGMTKSKSTSDLVNKKKPDLKGFFDDTLIDYGNIFNDWNENERIPWDKDLVKKTLKIGLRPSLRVSRKNSNIGTSFIRNQLDHKLKKVKRIYLIEVMNCDKCTQDNLLNEFIDRTF